MNEVQRPKKPLMFYYAIALVVLVLLNSLVLPLLTSPRVNNVDYGEFMRMNSP